MARNTYSLSGRNNRERFDQSMIGALLLTLRPGDIVVTDNMRSHHVKAVWEVLDVAGMGLLYLPSYSPDLNPIEKMCSKVKAFPRKWKIRSLDFLPDAVRLAIDHVSHQDC